MALFDLHCDSIADFLGSSVSDGAVALNTWNTTRDLEDAGRRKDMLERAIIYQTYRRPDKREKVHWDIIALDTINLEEVGKY